MSLREQIEANFHLVFSKEIRDILIEGIKRGISIHERGIKTDRERLGYYANNKETRDIFSSLCRGLEEAIADTKSLLLQSKQRRVTSSYFIEIYNSDLILHIRHEGNGDPNLPQYMKNECAHNNTFVPGKKNYCTISYTGQKGMTIDSADIVVYDINGNTAYREKLYDRSINTDVA